jgi:bacterioferritin
MKTTNITNLEDIRRRAREHVQMGAVTEHYHADRTRVLALLNEALATEIVCNLRYKRHYFMAQGIASRSVADEFLEHAKDEEKHANWLAERIVQLDGEPDYNPAGLADRAETDYAPTAELDEMIQENLIAERIVIDTYTDMIRYLADNDPTTRRLIENILEDEEEHAEDLASLLASEPGPKEVQAKGEAPLSKTG